MNKMNLKDIQDTELQILKHFISICEKHDLRYYLAGGTLLGAVRHHGFIPWDDDIDVLMPRPDYDKLQKLSKEVNVNNYRLASHELHNLNYPFCKIYDVSTAINKAFEDDETEKHLWIDVFPLDGLPESDKETRQIFRKSLMMRKILTTVHSKDGTGKSQLKAMFKPVFKKIFSRFVGMKKAVSNIDRFARSYSFDDHEYVGGIVWGYGPQEKMKKSEYIPVIKVPFEDIEANAPGCYEKYLTALYGDYMKLPPKEKRITHDMDAWRK